MKPRKFRNLAKLGLIPMAVLVCSPNAQAVEYWWDNNGDTAGFGTASGTWSSTASLLSTSNTGVVTPTGTQATAGGDTAHFGTDTVGNGIGAGSITVDGNIAVTTLRFGSQSTGTFTFDTVNGGKITGGNGAFRMQNSGQSIVMNADYDGATTVFAGVSGAIATFNGNYKNTGQSSINGGLNVAFGSTATLNLTSSGFDGFNFNGTTGSLRYSSANDGEMGGINGAATATIVTKDGSATSTLKLLSANNHSGEYRIDAGTLQFALRNGLYSGNTANWLASKTKVGNTGVLGINVGGTNQFTTTDVTTLLTNLGGANGTSTTGFAAGSAIGLDTTNAAGGTFTVADIIADSTGSGGGAIGLSKLGTNTLILSGASTYTGATKIAGGTLKLDATGSIDNTSGVSLGTAGTFDVSDKGGYTVSNLTGSGTVIGALTVSTQLAIGNSPGTANFTSDLALGAASTYLYEVVGGTGAADLGDVAGGLTIGSGAVLDLVQLGTFALGEKFTLFAYDGSLTGTFLDADLNALADGDTFTDAGGQWLIDYDDATAGLNGGVSASDTYVTITAIAPIPEPSTALLGALGLLALLRRRRA